MKKKEFDLSLVSKYRTELMGFAIIGVLIMHLVSIGQVTRTMPIKAISLVPTMAFTETFLLLSGLGIVHSLQSRPTIVNYYKKRIKRLVIPYILMAFIPILLYVYLAKEQLIMYPYRLSTIDFWMGDGCLGMWYIAVTVFLYIIAPWLYSFQFFERKSRFLVLLGGGNFIFKRYLYDMPVLLGVNRSLACPDTSILHRWLCYDND